MSAAIRSIGSSVPVQDHERLLADRPHRLTDAVAALDLTLTADEIAALEDPYTPRLPTFF